MTTGQALNEVLIIEYIELCQRFRATVSSDEDTELRRYDRLDRLWYVEMTEADRAEVDRRLDAQDRARRDAEAP